MTSQERAAVVALVDSLFVNGQGDVAERLVLTSKEGRDLGGWCRSAIVDRIAAALAARPSVTTGRHADDYGAGLAEERRQKKEPV